MRVEFNRNHLQKMNLMYNLYNSKLGKTFLNPIEMETQQNKIILMPKIESIFELEIKFQFQNIVS